jgi:CheY-like chemotaxis protein
VTVDRADAALQKVRAEAFGLVISDITLDPNGYELCKQLKQAAPSTPVLLLSSRQNPYDNAAGSAAGADDHIDKPFDTQQLIDRVQKLLREGVGGAATQAQPVATVTAPAATGQNARARTLIYGGPGAPPAAPAPAPAPAPAAPVGGQTLPSAASRGMGFGAGNPMAKPAAAQPAPAARPAPAAAPAPAPKPVAAAPAAAPAISAAVNGHLAAKVGELGLTPAQADAVMALSRDVIERVVWEVVPVLAEALIKEELARLTK